MAAAETQTTARNPRGIGEVRRSAVASTFGPGSIVDFRTPGGAAVSVVMPGLDEWARVSGSAADIVHDPRLERALGVNGFRLPPIAANREQASSQQLPGVLFPKWLQCPRCHVLAHYKRWASEIDQAARWCAACSGNARGADRTFVVPVRFIMACRSGHIQDFPWEWWAEHKPECTNRSTLKLESLGPGLVGLKLICATCGGTKSMEAAFDEKVTNVVRCQGLRPWLPGGPEQCDDEKPPRVLQRGASNLYFPVIQSSLLIPPWDDEIEERVGDRWIDVLDLPPEQRKSWVLRKIEQGVIVIPGDWNPEEFADRVAARATRRESDEAPRLRDEEWDQIVGAGLGAGQPSRDFEVHRVQTPSDLRPHIAHVVRVVRLRELRALRGFTRIDPPPAGDETDLRLVPIATRPMGWLPAVEVRGEGIFVGLDAEIVAAWEGLENVAIRVDRMNAHRRREHADRFDHDEIPPDLPARHFLAHALAHAFMRQLALECGYSAASLRERIYSGTSQCGVLIYTATTDADGTLGGLQRQGQADRIAFTLQEAIRAQQWCSSDPLCIRDVMMASNANNLAACHACMLAPETSCEHFNHYLDRALLVGTPEHPEIGFFQEWLR